MAEKAYISVKDIYLIMLTLRLICNRFKTISF